MEGKDKKIFLLKMKRGIEDGIVFADSMEQLEEMKKNPTPHYLGFDWSEVVEIKEISKRQMETLIKKGKAEIVDL
jgi:hypothetical protein